jgi:hypothetical protein
MEIENARILATLTVGEFKQVMSDMGADKNKEEEKPHTYVYGIPGIMELFHCCRSTAQSLKDTVIRDAVSQTGRKIVVDVEYARALFKAKRPYKTIW